MKSISIVIPIHNEEQYLRKQVGCLVGRLNRMATTPRFEILLVENGSIDNTLHVARAIAKKERSVRVVSLNSPSYGEAFKAGVRMARFDIVVQFDIDFWSVSFLSRALRKIDEYDIVIGSKNIRGSTYKRSILRQAVSKFIEHSIRVRFNVPMTDTHGMKVLSREKIASVLDKISCPNHFLDTEILIRLYFRGCTYTEVPIQYGELRESRFSLITRARQVIVEYCQLMAVGLPRYRARTMSRPSYA